jgi:hypothetical protein
LTRKRGVQVGQRLVEQEHLGLAHDGAADGHALALAARQVLGLALQQVFDVQDLRRVVDRGFDLDGRHLGQLQAEGHVVVQVHVRVQRVALEDHRDAAFGRWHVVDHAAADAQLAFGDVLQPGNDMRSSVLLPQPLGPTKTMNSPSRISRSMPFKIFTSP